RLVGMGGGITSMGAVMFKMAEYDPDKIQGCILSLDEVERQIGLYSANTVEQRKLIVGLQPKRADVILASALIVKAIMGKLGVQALTVSDRGLRHGLLYHLGRTRR
ncbi:MAG TPA: Ppx/GppA family phosphatase, partial [Bacillota bacterium]|nr:Ppx/GppA family phosphatase [Bacillota bacterium]